MTFAEFPVWYLHTLPTQTRSKNKNDLEGWGLQAVTSIDELMRSCAAAAFLSEMSNPMPNRVIPFGFRKDGPTRPV